MWKAWHGIIELLPPVFLVFLIATCIKRAPCYTPLDRDAWISNPFDREFAYSCCRYPDQSETCRNSMMRVLISRSKDVCCPKEKAFRHMKQHACPWTVHIEDL